MWLTSLPHRHRCGTATDVSVWVGTHGVSRAKPMAPQHPSYSIHNWSACQFCLASLPCPFGSHQEHQELRSIDVRHDSIIFDHMIRHRSDHSGQMGEDASSGRSVRGAIHGGYIGVPSYSTHVRGLNTTQLHVTPGLQESVVINDPSLEGISSLGSFFVSGIWGCLKGDFPLPHTMIHLPKTRTTSNKKSFGGVGKIAHTKT